MERDAVTGEQPTEFGQWLIERMDEHDPPLSRPELALRVGVPGSTISRWIMKPGKPQTDKLAALAEALSVDYGEVLVRAGHGRPANQEDVDTGPRPLTHPLARELDRMLNIKSPLSERDRDRIRTLVDLAVDPYRPKMRRRAS